MSIHPSLRKDTKDKQQRSVLKRIERVNKLMDEGKWLDDKVFSLPKIKTVRLKIKKEKAAVVAGAEGATAPAAGASALIAGTPTEKGAKAKPESKQSK